MDQSSRGDGGRTTEARGGVPAGAISRLLAELVRAPERPDGAGWDAALRPGAVVGRFELVRELGRGGFGVVYEARDRELGRLVAFKALRAVGRSEPEERLLREADAAARLSHPNIVTLHDAGRSEHGPYLVLELLRGETLADRLRQGPLAPAEALRVACEVARGLAHAHAHGVVHRDLKPANVFLCDDGQVKLLDLGMAHAFGRRKLDGGTPAYMAPEQGRGAPEDERTDVFALGVLLHRMLSGELPWPEGAGARPGARAAPRLDVPAAPALGELVARMLEIDPVRRPRDGGEAAAALAALRGEVERAARADRPLVVGRAGRRGWRVALLVAAGVLAGAGAAALLGHLRGRAEAPPAPSVAVLPFADMSPQRDQEYFSDGLAEEILNALAQVDGLRVTARTSSFAFKGKDEDLRAIGQKLGVGALLEGSVRTSGRRVRITAQLVALPDGFHLWSETFDRDLGDVFAIQDEIAQAVTQALKVKLLPRHALAVREHRTAPPEAYEAFLHGRQAYARYSEEGFRLAREAFERAVALAPDYAPAWAGLSIPTLYAVHAADPAEAEPLRRRSLEAAERAVALDPELAEGYSARSYLRGVLRWDWRGAQADMDRALALSPNDATTLRRAGILAATMGRGREAVERARRAIEVDPLFPANWMALANFLILEDRLAEAREALARVEELAPQYEGVGFVRAMVEVLAGRPEAARPLFASEADEGKRLMGEALALHALGRAGEARQALEALTARAGERLPVGVAAVHAFRGERDEAFAWLERAYARRDGGLGDLHDRLYANLRGDPRFAELLRRVGLPLPGDG